MQADSEPSCLLESLPESLFCAVLSYLDPASIFRLHASSRSMQQAAGADSIWQPICAAQGWDQLPTSLQNHARPLANRYAAVRRTLCVECLKPTPYCFKLLNCRLCLECEPQHTKYNLCTKREACEGVGIPLELVDTLPFVVSCGLPFYLRTSILDLEAKQQAGERAAQRAAAGVESSEEEEEQQGCKRDHEQSELGYMSGLEEEKAHKHPTAAEKATAAAARKADEKAARKASKKQAKQDQRAKRHGGGPEPTVNNAPKQALSVPPSTAQGGQFIPGCRPRSQPRGRDHRAQNGGSGRSGGGARNSFGGRSLGSSSRISTTPPLEGQARDLHRSAPQASGWLQEREAIMQEFGPYSISGLVLVV